MSNILGAYQRKTSFLEIVKVMEPTMYVNRCLEEDNYCSRDAVDNCSIRKFYTNFQNIIEEKFSEITIKTLIDNK